MSDDQRGYREERPLSEIIPPDRRRAKALGLVAGGMVVGALLLVMVQGILSLSNKGEPHAPVIESFAAAAEHEDVTSARAGAIISDGMPDDEFELVVTGPVMGIVIAQHYPTGRPMPNATRWGTTDYEPAAPERSGYGMPEITYWQLAVTEGSRRLNDPLGGMIPLEPGKHRLVLHLSSGGAFTSGAILRAYVIGPGNAISTSDAVKISGDWAVAKPAPPSVPESQPQVISGKPFDRGAAAATLGAIKFDHCAKLAGAKPNGRVEVTFAPDGKVMSASVIEGVEPSTPAAQCVATSVKKQARVPEFSGAPVHVKKSFSLATQ